MNDTTLEELFSAAGSAYDLPEDALARVLEAAGESTAPASRRFDHPRLVAAGVLLVAAVGGAFLWSGDGGRHSGTSLTAAGPAAADFQVSQGRMPVRTLNGPAKAASPPAAAAPTNNHGLALGNLTYGSKGATTDSAATPDGAKIVHTGTLALVVAKGQVSAALSRVSGLATGVGGYVSSSTTAESGSRPSGTVVLRVPAGEYDTVLTQARALGTVASTTSAAQDVTAQTADQQARLTALKASRDQFLTILARAKTIGETLAVQQQVNETQTQIDQLQGQANVLADQAAYGSLTVTITQHAAATVTPAPVQRQSGLNKAWHRAVTGFVTGLEALVARSGRALLVLLVLLLTAGVLRTGWKVGRRRLV